MGARTVIKVLRDAKSLSKTRLSCKALRAFIDEHIEHLNVQVSPGKLKQHVQGKLVPSLALWPRCSSIRVDRIPVLSLERLNAAFFDTFTLPFKGLGRTAREGIRHLELNVPVTGVFCSDGSTLPVGSIVAPLADLLPHLRTLDLRSIACVSFSEGQQQRLYGSLAALPYLEELSLPGASTLDYIGGLADGPAGRSLRRLAVKGLEEDEDEPSLSEEGAAGLARLSYLEELHLEDVRLRDDIHDDEPEYPAASLTELLDALPPSLRKLRHSNEYGKDHVLGLQGGRLCSITLNGDMVFELDELSHLAEQLLASRVMADNNPGPNDNNEQQQQQQQEQQQRQQIEQFHVNMVSLIGNQAEEEAPLLALLARCKKITVRHITADSVETFQRLDALFGKPSAVSVELDRYIVCYEDLRGEQDPPVWAPPPQQPVGAAATSTAAAATGDVASVCAAAQPAAAAAAAALLPAEGVAKQLVQTLAGVRRPFWSSEAGTSGDAAGACGKAQQTASPRLDPGYASGMLLLRGKIISLLGRVPGLVAVWVDKLRAQSAVAGARDACVVSCVLLPEGTEAAVVDCRTERGAEAVAAAVRAATGGEVEVLPVQMTWGPRVQWDKSFARKAVLYELEQVLTDIWTARGPPGALAALGEKELVRRLVELAAQLAGQCDSTPWQG